MTIANAKEKFGREITTRHDLLAVTAIGQMSPVDEIGFNGFRTMLRMRFDERDVLDIPAIQPDGWALRTIDKITHVFAFEVEVSHLMTLEKLRAYYTVHHEFKEMEIPAQLHVIAVDAYGRQQELPLELWENEFTEIFWEYVS